MICRNPFCKTQSGTLCTRLNVKYCILHQTHSIFAYSRRCLLEGKQNHTDKGMICCRVIQYFLFLSLTVKLMVTNTRIMNLSQKIIIFLKKQRYLPT